MPEYLHARNRAGAAHPTTVRVDTPTIEHHRVPFGIGEARPRISWVTTAPASWAQTGVELRLELDGQVRTHEIPTGESVLVPWPFEALRPRDRGQLSVRVWGADGDRSGWSPATTIEAGLLRPGDWVARAIGAGWTEGPAGDRPPVLLRSEVEVPGTVVRARLYATAHGLHQTEINGIRVGSDELSPGWTSYHNRLRYYTYDVTGLVRTGHNAIGAWLADGWFRGRLGFDGGHVDLYGDRTAYLAQLEVVLSDGRRIVHATGDAWRSAPSPILAAGLLEGEHYDAGREQAGWSTSGFDDSDWVPAGPRRIDLATLVAPSGPPVRCTQELAPVSVDRRADGRLVLDFGQNLVGRLRISLRGKRGDVIRMRHAEVLDGAGELCTRPLRGAHSTDTYVLRGDDTETWEPRFTIHGFRFAEISGWGDQDVHGSITARVLHTDMRRTGWFEASDPDLNRLHENVVWSMRGNFVDLPTDCPQRDERLGWTGDIQVFAPTATFLYQCGGLLSSWLRDVDAEQLPDGTVPWYVPVIPGGEQWTPPRPGAGWGDAAVLIPWTLGERLGDAGVLRRQYASARAWADLQYRLAGPRHVWDRSYQLGDWLDPSAPPDDPAGGLTDPNLVATAYYAHSSDVLARTARRIGSDDADELDSRAYAARQGFRDAYRTGGGRLTSDSQAAYALAIAFGLFDEDELPAAGKRLADLVRAADHHLTTGFLGTPVLLDALTRTGHRDVAHQLLGRRTVPSWLYPVTMGATTVWERWDSMLPDGSVNPGDMTSFNHYAFGAVADWMHREVAGIACLEPGWRRIRFRPGVESGLDWARAAHETPYGRASIRWERRTEGVEVEIVVPTGTTAVREFPGMPDRELGPGVHTSLLPEPACWGEPVG
ncbi:alpha-L-rhamnosidase [Myceligenerans indicum]|uniref:alpha-L-rhamnosidase n=1 Tax=Myceligenerans indicum TaxID=2593663 RepID=A0ABS1LGA1_9MICO|nr:alpha-L-rhamnosidase [Myceligenerans indicum]MBL0885221.1 family 78 glycoside hydrolase catalytic domain [Myceligenerans indicum]